MKTATEHQFQRVIFQTNSEQFHEVNVFEGRATPYVSRDEGQRLGGSIMQTFALHTLFILPYT